MKTGVARTLQTLIVHEIPGRAVARPIGHLLRSLALLSLTLFLGSGSALAQVSPGVTSTGHTRSMSGQASVEVGFMGAAASYAWDIGRPKRVLLGIAAGGGAQYGFSIPAGQMIDGIFLELAHASLFLRIFPSEKLQVEFGPRVAWIINGSEYETRFLGAYVGTFFGSGRLKIGGRLLAGVQTSEGVGSQFTLSAEPLVLAFRWPR